MNEEIVEVEVSKNELGGYDVRVRTKNHTIYSIGRVYDLRSFPQSNGTHGDFQDLRDGVDGPRTQ